VAGAAKVYLLADLDNKKQIFFQGKASPPQIVVAKTNLLLSESINSRPLKIEDSTNWIVREKDWMASIPK